MLVICLAILETNNGRTDRPV